MTWWHGGPRIRDDYLLPPSETGQRLVTEWHPTDTSDIDDPTKVYLVNDRTAALMYAAVQPDPWLYQVEPEGPIEDDPDFTQAASGTNVDGLRSVRVLRARILRRLKPSRAEVEMMRRFYASEYAWHGGLAVTKER